MENGAEGSKNPSGLSQKANDTLALLNRMHKNPSLREEMNKEVSAFVQQNQNTPATQTQGNEGQNAGQKQTQNASNQSQNEGEQNQSDAGQASDTKISKDTNTTTQTDGQNEGQNTQSDQGGNGKKSLLFGDKKQKKQNQVQDIKFESVDDFKTVAKKYGVEVSDPKDFGKMFSAVDKWRDDSQKLPEIQKQAEGYKGILENLDPVLLDSVKAYHSGQDWKKVINEGSRPFDITKPVEKQDIKKLVEHYFPGKFEENDFAADEKPKALEIAEQSAKDKFVVEQTNFNSQRAEIANKAKAKLEARANSIDGSVKELQKSFPDLDHSVTTDVKKILDSGDIHSLFYNADGSYKPDAAKRIMLALYGEQEFSTMMEAEAKQIESKVTENIISRASDKPISRQGAGGGKTEVSKETQSQLDLIRRLGKGKI